MGRKQPKEHGSIADRFFVGMPAGKTILIEDTTTTGGSLLQSIEALLTANIDLVGVIGLTNRLEKRDDGRSVAEAVGQYKINGKSLPYFALSNLPALLPAVFAKQNSSPIIQERVKEYFDRYGVNPLRY